MLIRKMILYLEQTIMGVDVDTAMTDLAKNSMQYQAIATLQSKHFGLMKEMIRGGGG